jgi:hypothetical protein
MYGGIKHNYHTNKDILNQDYAACLELASQQHPLIFFVENSDAPWYFLVKRAIDPVDRHQYLQEQSIDLYQDFNLKQFLKTYFDNSLNNFEKNIWDLRELVALNFDYFKLEQKAYFI